jgi:hypothetical protein
MTFTGSRAAFLVLCGSAATWFTAVVVVRGQSAPVPSARLVPASTISLPGAADSNSPAAWELVDGRLRFFVLTSVAGESQRAEGADVTRLASRGQVTFESEPGGGVWFEAIIPDVDGTWYGFYHNEWPAQICADVQRTIPRIRAARSSDLGATWQDLGAILESPPGTVDCASSNKYFVGGVGDFSVMLDDRSQYLYVFFSQYANRESAQGVSVARMAWADRDQPSGKITLWLRDETWLPARPIRTQMGARYIYPAGAPIYPVAEAWHRPSVDAFWGPSVHWNTYLRQYVMLLNRAKDPAWTQEGIYVAFSPRLDDPKRWSIPQRLMSGGRWYPQVIGTEAGIGSDRVAGERARFFVQGRSDHLIQFSK